MSSFLISFKQQSVLFITLAQTSSIAIPIPRPIAAKRVLRSACTSAIPTAPLVPGVTAGNEEEVEEAPVVFVVSEVEDVG